MSTAPKTFREQRARELTLEKKIKLLKELDAGATQRYLARKHGISKTTVGNINKNRAAIIKTWKINNSGERKRILRKTGNDMINTLMWQFLQNNRSQNNPISGPLLKIKALEIAKMLRIETFKASRGWLRSFLKGRNIDPRTFVVNSDEINIENEEREGNEENDQTAVTERINEVEEREEVNGNDELPIESDKLLAQFCMEPVVKIEPGKSHLLKIDVKEEQVEDDEYENMNDEELEEDEDEHVPSHEEALSYAEKLLKYSNTHKPDLLPKLCEIYNSIEGICNKNWGL